MSFKASVSLLIFCLDCLSIDKSGVLKSPAIIVLVSTSPISVWYKLNTFYSANVFFHWFMALFFCNKYFQQEWSQIKETDFNEYCICTSLKVYSELLT